MAKSRTDIRGVNRRLSEAYAVQDLWVKHNDCELEDGAFVDFECVYGGRSIPGVLTYMDQKGFTSDMGGTGTDIREGGFMTIGFVDAHGCKTQREFAITTTQKLKDDKEQELIMATLTDKNSRNMKSSYVAKGYPETKYSEAIEKHFKEIKNADTIEVHGPKKGKEEKINMIVGASESFDKILQATSEDKNYKLITDRQTNYFVHKENTVFDDRPDSEEIFEYDAKAEYLYRILQYSIEGFDAEKYMQSGEAKVSSDDEISTNATENLEGLDGKQSVNKIDASPQNKTVTKGVKGKDMVATRGVRQTVIPSKEKDYFDAISSAQKMSIWVPGKGVDRVGKLVEVHLPRPKGFDSSTFDPVFTGKWEVYFVRDKLINYYFVQELLLRRPGH